jgi:RNA polymerase sigma factor (sigma-70 family)
MSDDNEMEKLSTPGSESGTQASRSDLIGNTQREQQFNQFYRLFTPRLVRFLMWHGASLHLSADVAQEAMRRAYDNWETIKRPEAWVRVVAGRELVRHQIDQRLETPVGHIPETPVLLADPDAVSEEFESVLKLLRDLPIRQRQVMAWTYDGFSIQEISEILKISEEAVRGSLYKARKSLAFRLSEPEAADD